MGMSTSSVNSSTAAWVVKGYRANRYRANRYRANRYRAGWSGRRAGARSARGVPFGTHGIVDHLGVGAQDLLHERRLHPDEDTVGFGRKGTLMVNAGPGEDLAPS